MANEPKYRWFTFLVYPSSAPADWWELCKSSHLQFARSPLHSPDGEMRVPHYHVIYRHPNSVRLDYVRRMLSEKLPDVVANGFIEAVVHPDVMQRYLLHLDDGEKEQFEGNPYDLIECVGGFPLDLSREYTPSERREQRSRIFALIRENCVLEYADLLDGLSDCGFYDLFDYACAHSILFRTYLASARGRVNIAGSATRDNVSYVKLGGESDGCGVPEGDDY